MTTFSHQNPQRCHVAYLLLVKLNDTWKRGLETISLQAVLQKMAQKWASVFHRDLLPNVSPTDRLRFACDLTLGGKSLGQKKCRMQSPQIFRIFDLNVAAPNFTPIFKEFLTFSLINGDHRKFTKIPAIFHYQMPRQSEKSFTKVLWRAGKVKKFAIVICHLGVLPTFHQNSPNFAKFLPKGHQIRQTSFHQRAPNLNTEHSGENRMEGTIPDAFETPRLRLVDLFHNAFSGSIPEVCSGWGWLAYLRAGSECTAFAAMALRWRLRFSSRLKFSQIKGR